MGAYQGNQNPKDWLLTVSLAPVLGFAKDSNIELELREDAVDADVGIQGDWVFVEKNDGSSTVKFTLYRNSSSNGMLHALLKTRSVFPVTLTNIRNMTVHTLPYVMIQKQPKDGNNGGSNANTLEWTLIAGETDSTII
ncbi:hypothetical protein FH968_17635 [Buttiauxella sp. B2]|uniref:hypothetical protein n=1 Tax=Buttiauxella sp. B2 TaxID=2587812 RepID=UPI001123046C|nr:hypothetical protein [Buttiauxella sp. B2]TNV17880.1 hypothetical protein FH968_17635 [Buttiauxella sp. B2]